MFDLQLHVWCAIPRFIVVILFLTFFLPRKHHLYRQTSGDIVLSVRPVGFSRSMSFTIVCI